jgi:eukaryotic-like serine/threonine-protein kinase
MTQLGVDDAIGNVIAGRFRITALLGRGGMASVYLAEDESLGRTVAIKVFSRDLADGDDLQRQQEEITLLATLNHPSLVTLFDASTDDDGNAYLVMELVDGTDLRARLNTGPLEPGEVATIGSHVADALAYVHTKGIIHRDIKPGNILLPEGDPEHTGPQAKLADFGIARIVDGARLTATGKVLGTASYFSPEQAAGEPITPASDIYSLGLVLLECLTGERAFQGTALESMMARMSRDPDVPRELGDNWVGLLRGMTSRNPEARPTARDVSGALARMSSSDATLPYPSVTQPTQAYAPHAAKPATSPKPLAAPPAITASPAGARTSRRRVLWTAGSVIALALAAWGATVVVPTLLPQPEQVTPVEYPAVDGVLGSHLEQLQRSVQP